MQLITQVLFLSKNMSKRPKVVRHNILYILAMQVEWLYRQYFQFLSLFATRVQSEISVQLLPQTFTVHRGWIPLTWTSPDFSSTKTMMLTFVDLSSMLFYSKFELRFGSDITVTLSNLFLSWNNRVMLMVQCLIMGWMVSLSQSLHPPIMFLHRNFGERAGSQRYIHVYFNINK